MENGIENFAGVVIRNSDGRVLVVRKASHYAYAIPWCRILPGKSLKECLKERVMDLTGIRIQPVFLGPSEHIQGNSHFISFDHLADVDIQEHRYSRKDLEYLWIDPCRYHTVPLVPLTQDILEKYCRDQGIRTG